MKYINLFLILLLFVLLSSCSESIDGSHIHKALKFCKKIMGCYQS